MATQNKPFSEEDFLSQLSLSMDLMGISNELVELEEFPLSIELTLPGYEELPLEGVLMFLPIDEAYGGEIRIFQIYFSLYDQDISPEKYDQLESLFNTFNTSSSAGCFGVQRDISRICFKQSFPTRDDRDSRTTLQTAMDTLILMALTLDKTYDQILGLLLS